MVIPIADDNPTRRRPWFTRALVLANVLVFVALTPWAGSTCDQVAFYTRWATVPLEVVQGTPLTADQLADTTPEGCRLPVQSAKDVYAAVLASMFLHGGWVHLGFNMLYLWIFGNNVEDRLGHLGFLGFYVLTGAIATLVFIVANPGETTSLVGASGAIAGILGAYLVLFPRARIYASVPFLFFLVVPLPAALVLVLWFVGQVGALRMGELAGTGVAYLAHVGGFAAGVALTLLLGVRAMPGPLPPRRAPPRGRRRRRHRGRRHRAPRQGASRRRRRRDGF